MTTEELIHDEEVVATDDYQELTQDIAEVSNQMEILSTSISEVTKKIAEISPVKDKRPLLEKVSLTGKITKMERQLDVIRRQETDPTFTYDAYLELVATDVTYTPTSYFASQYLGKTLAEDADLTNEKLIKDSLPKSVLENGIAATKAAIGLAHMSQHLVPHIFPVDESTMNSKAKRTTTKIYKKYSDESSASVHAMSVDLNSVYQTLAKLNPTAIATHRKFIYSLCQYIDKYYVQAPLTIVESISAISNLIYGTKLEENVATVTALNAIYENL